MALENLQRHGAEDRPMSRSQAVAHLLGQVERLATDNCVPLGTDEVLEWLREPGRLERVLLAAYVQDEGRYWPAFATAHELWPLVWRVLITSEPRPVPSCPPWCDEHRTRHRHRVEDEHESGGGFTVSHSASHGAHVIVTATEQVLATTGPTLTKDEPTIVVVIEDENLTPLRARQLAAHLLDAATALELALAPATDTTTTTHPDTEHPA